MLKRLTSVSRPGEETGQGVIEYTLTTGVIAMGIYAAFALSGLTTAIGDVVTGIIATFGA